MNVKQHILNIMANNIQQSRNYCVLVSLKIYHVTHYQDHHGINHNKNFTLFCHLCKLYFVYYFNIPGYIHMFIFRFLCLIVNEQSGLFIRTMRVTTKLHLNVFITHSCTSYICSLSLTLFVTALSISSVSY